MTFLILEIDTVWISEIRRDFEHVTKWFKKQNCDGILLRSGWLYKQKFMTRRALYTFGERKTVLFFFFFFIRYLQPCQSWTEARASRKKA